MSKDNIAGKTLSPITHHLETSDKVSLSNEQPDSEQTGKSPRAKSTKQKVTVVIFFFFFSLKLQLSLEVWLLKIAGFSF